MLREEIKSNMNASIHHQMQVRRPRGLELHPYGDKLLICIDGELISFASAGESND